MYKYIPILVTVLSTTAVAVLNPQFISAHPMVAASLAVLAQVLHAVMPSTSTAINQRAVDGANNGKS